MNNKENPSESYIALMYHETTSPAKTKYYVSIEEFEEQIKMFQAIGVKSYDIETSPVDLKNNIYVLFTFDDGHRSNLQAAKILSKYGFKGYFYIVKEFSLYDDNYLSEKEIKKISEMGHSIGVHGYDHEHWTKKSSSQLIEEIRNTKSWLEKLTGKPISSCAAPGGIINSCVVSTIKKSFPEIKMLRTVIVGINQQDDFLVKIIPVHTNTSRNHLLRLCQGKSFDWWRQKSIYYFKEVFKGIRDRILN